MPKRTHFITTIAIMTLLNALDMASTYYSTPDLYNEGNYYVVKYHFGWPGLIFVEWATLN